MPRPPRSHGSASSSFPILLCAILLTAAIAPAQAANTAPLAPTRIRIIDTFEQLGVDRPTPAFGWVVNDADRGERQTAYQIVVSSSEAGLANGDRVLWDSGKIRASDQYGIAYGGKALAKTTPYWWKVRTWDKDDTASPWSAPARFVTGFFQASDWNPDTAWICHPDAVPAGSIQTLPMFRKTFEVSKPVQHAFLYVTGLGQFVASLNGARLGDHEIDPAWTDYDRTIAYVTFDVTSALRTGKNALGVMLGTGWLNGTDRNAIRSFRPLRMRAELHVTYADGSTATVVSDPTWKVDKSPFTATELHGAESYDARLEQTGWDTANFDDAAWTSAALAPVPSGVLVAQSAPPVLSRQTLSPVRIMNPAPYVQVFDFGQNMNGQYQIAVRGLAGTSVTLISGEALKADGTVNPGRSTPSSYTLKGNGLETWRLTFSTTGFRYLQVSAATRDSKDTGAAFIEDAKAFFTYTGAAETGKFSTSDPRYNQIHDIALRTIRSNFASLHTDGPNQEKLGWQEVVATISSSAAYAHDLQTLLAKIGRDMRDGQRTFGLVPNIVPNWFNTNTAPARNAFDDSPAWGCSAFTTPWLVYQIYGDRRILEENYVMMTSYLAYLKSKERDGVVQYGLGDWMAPAGNVVANIEGAVYVRDTQIMRDVARVLGKSPDVELYTSEYERVRRAYNDKFFDAAAGSYRPMMQSTQAVPLAFGIVPDGQEQRVVAALKADIAQPAGGAVQNAKFGRVLPDHVTTGDIGTTYLWRVLGDNGQNDLVQTMIMQPDSPSYWSMIQSGETTITEHWDSPRTRSHNHDMYAGILEWFYRSVGGISSLQPGYAEIQLKPALPAGLKQVTCSYESVRGTIASDLGRDGQNGTWTVRIPANGTAKVCVPVFGGDPSKVTIAEGGKTLWKDGTPVAGIPGIRFDRLMTTGDQQYVVWAVGSGTYQFTWR